MSNPYLVIAATGHRPNKLGGYDLYDFQRLVQIARRHLSRLQPDEVITGMAQGWDQAVAQACAELNIPFVAAVPFRGQESCWPKPAQAEYNRLLRLAKKVVVVSDGDYHIGKMQRRNRWMVDHAHLVLALYNGDLDGGTCNCIRYARRKNKPILNTYLEYCS